MYIDGITYFANNSALNGGEKCMHDMHTIYAVSTLEVLYKNFQEGRSTNGKWYAAVYCIRDCRQFRRLVTASSSPTPEH